ncbi:ATP-binding protein [Spongisporangium articulatum]|uniref:Signal transduction histidine-protein kinase/phosphatase MprB n=1 Tax=Spongisporangium articulatum TaxID=3362603 RepID=A0ABW8APK1_9ACTN
MKQRLARLWDALRPLDPLRSIQAKLGVLIVASGFLIAAFEWFGVVVLGWRVRYGLAVAVVVSLVITRVLAHGMTAPLRQITRATRELAEGEPMPPIQASSRDEVGELARAFTDMAGRLAAVDSQRRELLGNVSHELRTPVAALRAQLENLVDGVRPPDADALADLLGQVEALGGLVDDLLDLARVDGGAVRLRYEPVPVRELAESVAAQVRLARPGPTIAVRVEPADLTVDADRHRLAQVVLNLLDNAARHAGATGRVTVEARVRRAHVVVDVTDDGPGIPADRWETVFERFRGGTGEFPLPGAAGAPGRRDGGTGLGLAIARWAVALHGGTIAVVPVEEADPTAPGCRVRVELPISRPISRPISTESPDRAPGRSTAAS